METPRANSQNATRRTAYVETFGCQMNISDGELMEGILAARGYDIASRPEQADVILVNTCAIREHAEQRVIGRIGQLAALKQERPDLLIGVTGCMAQRMGESLLRDAPHVDLVMGPDAYRGLPEALDRLRESGNGFGSGSGSGSGRRQLPVLSPAAITKARGGERLAVLDFAAHENYEGLEARRSTGASAWVPIQRGCDHRCTYCIVPYVRGPEKNRASEHVLEEIRGLVAAGAVEVTLLGQTVNSYRSGDWDFARLLRAVARIEGIRRVRFTSPHPNDVTPELIAVMAEEPTVCRQLHLPVQAGHDRTLKRMLRRYTVDSFLEKVELVRAAIPGIALSTDIIVAFPGETEAEYEATLDLVRLVRFDDAYTYRYSAREGTPATRLPAGDFVPDDVAQARLERLIAVHRGIQAEINRAAVGTVAEVLVERRAKSAGDMLGRTESNKVVAFPGGDDLVGRMVDVRISGTTGSTFVGVLEKVPEASAA
ncbi:MAG TPA: MiaB/RimO family radical SAM methylthiotransferase [Longimicrobiales bacterium]|nr:MiaB/RimO family radical SAM methylthiotransferase [Longimicrobiales bacterium]